MDEILIPSDPEKGLPQTVRQSFPNENQLAGTIVIFCIGDTIEVKARGLAPRQVVKLLSGIISKIS